MVRIQYAGTGEKGARRIEDNPSPQNLVENKTLDIPQPNLVAFIICSTNSVSELTGKSSYLSPCQINGICSCKIPFTL